MNFWEKLVTIGFRTSRCFVIAPWLQRTPEANVFRTNLEIPMTKPVLPRNTFKNFS